MLCNCKSIVTLLLLAGGNVDKTNNFYKRTQVAKLLELINKAFVCAYLVSLRSVTLQVLSLRSVAQRSVALRSVVVC